LTPRSNLDDDGSMVRGLLTLVALATLIGAGAHVVVSQPPWRTLLHVAVAPAPEFLPIPVAGVRPAMLADTFGAPRPGGRRHQGIDIFAKRGTPVVAPIGGVVLRTGQNRLGGNVVWLLGPGQQVHYLAHLDRFGVFDAGDVVRAGDVLGYVGNTGNAKGTPPHLHYGIYARPGGAVNPFPMLRTRPTSASRSAAGEHRRSPT
jgi:murein DD-endopeptidase MepM/ murein hydrolase activator NlpD